LVAMASKRTVFPLSGQQSPTSPEKSATSAIVSEIQNLVN
jgi:hypothetical protein